MDNWFNVRIKPMLPALSSEPFDSPTHIYEAKWDGVRCLAYVRGDAMRLQNRRLLDISGRYPELASLPASLNATSVLLDGVLLVIENGKPSPQRSLQREYVTDLSQIGYLATKHPAVFVAFDLLFLNGEKVMERPLRERKDLLRLVARPSSQLVVGTWVEEKGTALLGRLARLGLSGVVAKERESTYRPGQRSTTWLKMQRFKMQDCLICGYTEGQGRRAGLLGSLVLGVYCAGQLVHIGQVGSGYDHATLCDLHRLLEPGQRATSPFTVVPRVERAVTWVEPQLICEVQYAEWTAECKLRSPRFVRLREDKRREECQLEEVQCGPHCDLEPLNLRLPA